MRRKPSQQEQLNLISCGLINELHGVKVSNETVRRGYEILLKEEKPLWFKRLYDLNPKVEPSPGQVRTAQQQLLKQRDGCSIRDLTRKTNVDPIFPQHLVSEVYNDLCKSGNFYEFAYISKIAGPPSECIVAEMSGKIKDEDTRKMFLGSLGYNN